MSLATRTGSEAARPAESAAAEFTDFQTRYQLLCCLLDSIPDRIYFKDRHGAFILVSRSQAEYLGARDPAEVVGRSDFDYFDPALARAALEDEQRLMETGTSIEGKEEEKKFLDGRTGWALVTKVPLRDAEGRIIGTCGISKDVTALKETELALQEANMVLAAQKAQLEQSMAELQQARKELLAAKLAAEEASRGLGPFFQVALDMLCIAGMDGYFKRINPAFCTTLGYPEAELLGRPYIEFVHPDDIEKTGAAVEHLGAGKNLVNFVNRYRHRDGHYLWIDWTAAPNAEGTAIYAAARNITRRIQVQEELRLAREAAEAANLAKSAFLANMSHEIRTPMNGVIGMTDLLANTEMTADQRGCLNLIRQSADSLMTVLNDVLDFSKIEAGKMELERHEFDLRSVIGDTLQALAVRSAEKNIELACFVNPDVPDCLMGDAGRLRQILINLVGNAIKFTQQGEIVVEVRTEEQTDDQVMLHVKVSDTGIGIPVDKQEAVFEAFTQAECSTTRRFGGTGLGLTISRQLVVLMQGRLWLESEPGKGSIFHFNARFGLSPHQEPAARLMPEQLRGLTVLVVDDNATNRTILERMLLNWDMRPLLAASGREALMFLDEARTRGAPIPLMLLDYMMPEMDGAEVCRQVQANSGGLAPRILILTSGGGFTFSAGTAALGIDRCLTKPVKQSELHEAITRVMGAATGTGSTAVARTGPGQRRTGAMHLLLVEDGRVNQVVAAKLLEERGHTVTLAGNGREALDILAHHSGFDAVLMDVHMPEMNGFDATAEIRRREAGTGRHIPVIAMTANAMKGDRELCLAAGMDDYLSKPVQSAALYSTVEKYAGLNPHRESPAPSDAETDAICGTAVFDPVQFESSIRDKALMQVLIQVFFEDAGVLLADARRALLDRDASGLYQAAHSLKGMLGNYAAGPAFQAASTLSRSTRLGSLDHAEEMLAVLTGELSRLGDELKAFQQRL